MQKKLYKCLDNVTFKKLPPGKNTFKKGDKVKLTDDEAAIALRLCLIELAPELQPIPVAKKTVVTKKLPELKQPKKTKRRTTG